MSFHPFALTRRRLLAATALAAATPAAPGRAASGRATDTVRLTWGFSGLPLIAKERGAFAEALGKEGIKVEWVGPFPNHVPSIQAVVGDSADFSFGGSTTPALAAILGGTPLVFSLFAWVDPRTTAIIAKDGSGIDSIKDLAGRTVAVNRSGLGEFLLIAALEKYGVDRAKVTVVYMNPPDAAPAFGSGKVDAWSMWSPQVDIARSQYKAHDLFLEGRDLDYRIDYNSWLVRKPWADRNPDLIRAVNAAFVAESQWANANPAQAELYAQQRGGYSDAIRDVFIAQKRRYTVKSVNDAAFVAELQKAADWLTVRKILPETVVVADHLAKLEVS
jgi:sulfonate transport system substrate-binding protein